MNPEIKTLSMELDAYKAHLKRLLVEKESAVLSNLSDSLKQDSDAFDHLIILQASRNQLKRKVLKGILSNEESNLASNQIRAKLIEVINLLTEEDLIKPNFAERPSNLMDEDNLDGPFEEQFQEPYYWKRLEKIGRWQFDSDEKYIMGSGMFQYLLSHHEYGQRNCTILAQLQFDDYEKHADRIIDNANAGIILGWQKIDGHKLYYNLLFTGEKMVLEGIGLFGADEYTDFVHFDEGVAFVHREGQKYNLAINITATEITVFVNDVFTYAVKKPKDLYGKIGLRPWRSTLRCWYFEIRE